MAKSPLPLLLGAAAAFLVLSKRGGNGGEVQNNIYLIEGGDTKEEVVVEMINRLGVKRLVMVLTNVPSLTPEKVGAAVLPYAKANPEVWFMVIAGQAALESAASWFGASVEDIPPGSLAIIAMDPISGGEGEKRTMGLADADADAKLDEFIKWSVETELAAEGTASGNAGMSLRGSGPIMARTIPTGSRSASFRAPAGPSGLGLGSAPVALTPEVAEEAIDAGLDSLFSF